MGQYLDQIDAAPAAEKWPLVRQLMTNVRQPFFAELRNELRQEGPPEFKNGVPEHYQLRWDA